MFSHRTQQQTNKVAKALLLLLGITGITTALAQSPPNASFVQNLQTACVPMTVQFSNTSQNAVSYYWDMGNGNTSTLESPSNVYLSGGVYDVMLVATNSGGVSDTMVMVGAVNAINQPVAGYYAQSTSSCLAGNSINFVNTTAQSSYWLWDFGDGNTSTTQHPVHSYNNPGNYSVTLIAGNADSCEKLITKPGYITIFSDWDAVVTVDDSAACDASHNFQFSSPTPGINSWLWDFGNGATSNLQNPVHTYPGPGTYTVTLSTTNSNGCTDFQVLNDLIVINSGAPGVITAASTGGCRPFTAVFGDSSPSSRSWSWDFGDGSTDTLQSPEHVYNDAGVFTVNLTVVNASGCTLTTVAPGNINVQDAPIAKFNVKTEIGCSPFITKIGNKTTGANSWYWDFGNGTTSTQEIPAPVYDEPGIYTVTLVASSNNACADTLVKVDLIEVQGPTAKFGVSSQEGCSPFEVAFTDSSLDAVNWLWEFGDGVTSTQQHPTHVFDEAGEYSVSLAIKDTLGCHDTGLIASPLQATMINPAYTPPAPYYGCSPFSVGFEDNTPNATGWAWDFGDSMVTATSRIASHTYSEPGTYSVSLQVRTGTGCDKFIPVHSIFVIESGDADFTYELDVCDPRMVSFTDSSLNGLLWFWEFGDSATSSDQNPVHVYEHYGRYVVKLQVATASGCAYSAAKMIVIKPGPAMGDPYFIPADSLFPMSMDFFANSETATSWFWDFGDSATSSLENPTHYFGTAPSYPPVVVLSDGQCTDTIVLELPGAITPGFSFGGSQEDTGIVIVNPAVQGCAPFQIQFQSESRNAESYSWDFGDGSTSTYRDPLHLYTSPGIYDVIETTVDENGQEDTLLLDAYIVVGGAVAEFTSSSLPSCDSIAIAFTDSSTYADQWNWNFGDGHSFSGQMAAHTYPAINTTYNVALTVTDSLGCANSMLKGIYTGYDEPQFSYNTTICISDTAIFQSSQPEVSSWLWDFGDGSFSNDSMPAHQYAEAGTFPVTLSTIDQSGCTRSFSPGDSVRVLNPVADFTSMSALTACDAVTVNFANTSSGASSYSWHFGDGTSSTAFEPVKQYNSPGQYSVTLTAFREGCESQKQYADMVQVIVAKADFEYEQSNFCLPVTVNLYDSSTAAVDWLWNFGDGSGYDYSQAPAHVFTDAPSGDISLTIVDSNGCTASISKPNIGVLQSAFSTGTALGCAPFSSTFTDQSQNAVAWHWDFGDGYTSTSSSPAHTYQDTGVFTVQLVVESADGCFDTLIASDAVEVHKPVAAFTSATVPQCAPSLVSFQDQSINGVTYNWDFGDGTGSSNMNPNHIYIMPGAYSIGLQVVDAFGCSDSVTQASYVQVLGPVADASLSEINGCEGMEIQFSDQSVNAVSWSWSFGDGNASAQPSPDHVFEAEGSYTVSLIVEDSIGCTSLFVAGDTIEVHPLPVASASGGDSLACSPYMMSFENNSAGAESYSWIFDDGTTSTLEIPQHEFEAGVYAVSLIAYSDFGCSDTGMLALTVHQSPSADFSSGVSEGCFPLLVDFINLSHDTIASQFSWQIGDDLSSGEISPVISVPSTGFIDVTLQVTNDNGCMSDLTMPGFLNISDTLAPVNAQIELVTALSNTAVSLKWEAVLIDDFAEYRILRKKSDQDTYLRIKQINDRAVTSFLDDNVNTLTSSYCYKIQTVDKCGNVSATDELSGHCTIEVSASTFSDRVTLAWKPYRGCDITSYDIYRSEFGESAPELLASLDPGALSFVDSSIICPEKYTYRILGTSICGEEVVSLSDTAVAGPIANRFLGQGVDIMRSTVVDNERVLTEWAAPTVSSEYVTQYDIYRSAGNAAFKYLTSAGPYTTSYVDEDVNVNKQSYRYRIEVRNVCEVSNPVGLPGNSILLQGDVVEDYPELYWTPYQGWDQGVDHYEVERLNSRGEWKVIKTVGPNETKVIIEK